MCDPVTATIGVLGGGLAAKTLTPKIPTPSPQQVQQQVQEQAPIPEKLPEAPAAPPISPAESARVITSTRSNSSQTQQRKRRNNNGTILTSTAGLLKPVKTDRKTLLGE